MKEKKFPVLPVSILGVAIVGGAIMVSNKPLVGDMEEIMKAKEQQAREEAEQKALHNVSGDSRKSPSDVQLKNELKASMEVESNGGNMGIRDSGPKTPLILTGVRKQVKKVPINDAMPSTGWFREEFRGEKK